MTARPQQMPDGQEKSDDLIAELAKLMASGAGGAEPEAKPAPKLVTLGDNSKPLGAGPGSIRVPGMDAPITPAPVAPPAVLRIPGMDQPVAATPAAPRPVTPIPAPAQPAPPPAEPKPAASFDFGTLPPAGSLKPEPLANWQDREIPKPVSVRPASIEPVSTPPAPSFAPPAPTVVAIAAPEPKPVDVRAIVAEAPRIEPGVDAPKPVSGEPLVTSAKPQPEGDAFNFDFGFGAAPPAPIESAGVASRPSTGDPIADLIAADLDTPIAFEDEPAPAARPPAPQPAARPFPQPAPQRPLSPLPMRSGPSAPVRAPELDRTTSAPVFAQGRPPAPVDHDPMEEIESLIGEAVRVELSNTEKPAVQPMPAHIAHGSAPVVPPLTTGFAPRRAALKDTDSQISSAEAAILAAAAAAGAETGRIEGNVTGDSSPYKRPRAKPEKRTFFAGGMRQYVGMAVAGTLLLAAGFGLYWVLGMGRANDADAPVLQADATPVKETPPAATAPTDAQGSVVFNEMDGVKTDPNEQLVSRDSTADTPVADVARTVGDEADAASESELANRKVRTVTVRPDGTIVSGDEAVAGSEALPVDRPNVPDLPGEDVQPSELLASVPTNDTPATAVATPADTTSTVAAYTPNPNAVIDATVVAPVPAARPADRSVLGGGANAKKVATPVDTSAPLDLVPANNDNNAAPAAVSSSGGAYVQLSSQRSEADAQASLRTTKNRLGSSLNGAGLEIRRVDLGAKGIWYRVVLPTGSFQSATQTCASMKANGVECVAING